MPPVRDIIHCSWGCGSVGRALPSHGRGHEFESRQLHQFSKKLKAALAFSLCERGFFVYCHSL